MNVSDLVMAAVFFVMGGSFLLIRRQQEGVRRIRVSKGELTAEQALKKNRLTNWGICFIFGIALLFLAEAVLRI